MHTPQVYPSDHEVKVEWTWIHKLTLAFSVLSIWPLFLFKHYHCINISKLCNLAGLNIDIIGVVIASLKTPFYGHFADGGQIEVTRANTERKYFQLGMLLIAIGFFLQALGSLL